MKNRLLLLLALAFSLNCEKDFSPVDFDEIYPDNYEGEVVEKKPNIYLYPTKQIILQVSIIFPSGGAIIESIPAYNNRWDIIVEESGLINNEFEYLYYESRTPDFYQYEKGWIINRLHIKEFFKDNMLEYGFNTKEIDDFTLYWIPQLQHSDLYAIYPQTNNTIDKMIELKFSEHPESVLRLFYIIKIVNEDFLLSAPQINKFERNGFSVVEWGVVLKE